VTALLFFETRLDNPLRLLRTFAIVVAPRCAAWMLARGFAVTVRIDAGRMVVRGSARTVEVPCASIVAVEPWTVPLPSSGIDLRLRSGRRFPLGLAVDDSDPLTEALVGEGATPALRSARDTPTAAYARTRAVTRRWWSHPLVKYVAFALVPTLPLFRLHQWIAYGGTFGEYHTYGLRAYVVAFLLFWAAFTIYLVLWGAVLRVVAEGVVGAVAWRAPRRAVDARRAVEIASAVLYAGGVAAFLLRVALLAS
jgi:apolipoprotein N-acyltransferase